MLDILIEALSSPRLLPMVFGAVAAIATVISLAMPLLVTDSLSQRMKSVALEREQLRQRERERLARGEKIALRR
jgi:tight adherence protein C